MNETSTAFFSKKKVRSVFLFLSLFLFLGAVLLTSFFITTHVYSSTYEELCSYVYGGRTHRINEHLEYALYLRHIYNPQKPAEMSQNIAEYFQNNAFDFLDSGYSCEIYDASTKRLLYTHDPNKIISSQAYLYQRTYENTNYQITGYIAKTLPDDSAFITLHLFIKFALALRYPILIVLLLSAIAGLASLHGLSIYYRRFQAPVHGIARIPIELLILMFCGVNFGVINAAQFLDFSYPMDSRLILQGILAMLLVAVSAFSLQQILTAFLKRLGNHTLRKTCLLVTVPVTVLRGFYNHISRFSLTCRGLLIYCIISILELIFLRTVTYRYTAGIPLTGWLLSHAAIFCILWYLLYNVQQLCEGMDAIADQTNPDPFAGKKMYGIFQKMSASITNLGAGLTHAVQERLKSEHLKTELITNVSHDIKTPLTSIINYVDLLKKEPLENEKALEYIQVLERQSLRLKKLILDLIEASKATTGNIEMHLQRCEINVLLEQLLGEYADRMADGALTPVISLPQEPVYAMADGQHLWRCMDNLMINICKYSLAQTRVYLSLEVIGGKVTITFKNISSAPLNVSPHELMERFVRGDSSRSTEGNGLGLSISQSLMKLQNGDLALDIDGDLFKAVLTLPVLPAAPVQNEAEV